MNIGKVVKKIRLALRISSLTQSIRDYVNAMVREDSSNPCYEENRRILIRRILELIDLFQQLLTSQTNPPVLPDYEEFAPEDVTLSLPELLILFRRTLEQLQETPPHVKENAVKILYSYFIELQGLYDLIFVSMYQSNSSLLPLSPSAIEDHQKRYLHLSQEIENDPLIQEYRSIQYNKLMSTSWLHHLHVIVFDLLPHYLFASIKDMAQGKGHCRRSLDPSQVHSVDELRTLLSDHPLTEATKLGIALHRHTMRIFDILGTRSFLRWGRPILELIVLATWIQTVKDHILPGVHKPRWQVEHLNVEQEVTLDNRIDGKIKMSSAFFMQPRVTFRLERFLIFKNRTMTVGEVVRPHELGNWMRQNSPDEFLQFFNVALGDIGGLGIRTMPEHEILETQETQWLCGALMSFIPGGMTSPGSIVMRNTNYGLTKAQQLFHEILFYDPRFKGSSSFFTDLKVMVKSLGVMRKGRVGNALKKTESFDGKKRGF